MYCPKCGMEQQNDSQFCRSCGTSQSVASTSGTAAGVAPARIPVAAPQPQTNGSTAKWVVVGILLLLVAGGWATWQNSVHSYYRPPSASQLPVQQPPQQHKISMPVGAFTVGTLAASNYSFAVPAGAFDVTMKGHFAATGGSGNDIEVVVVNQDQFTNWQNGHPTKAFYSSGKVTQDAINLNLPVDAATYYVVFNNKFSMFSPKAVQANVDLTFYTR